MADAQNRVHTQLLDSVGDDYGDKEGEGDYFPAALSYLLLHHSRLQALPGDGSGSGSDGNGGGGGDGNDGNDGNGGNGGNGGNDGNDGNDDNGGNGGGIVLRLDKETLRRAQAMLTQKRVVT